MTATNTSNMVLWYLTVLLLCCSLARGAWKVDLHQWTEVPETISDISPQINSTMNFDRDWLLTFDLPKPITTDGSGSLLNIRVEQRRPHSSESDPVASSAILHEIGSVVPIALQTTIKQLYKPIDSSSRNEGILRSLASGLVSLWSSPSNAVENRVFSIPDVECISIVVSDYRFEPINIAVSMVESPNSIDPLKRTMHLSLGWFRESWENPLPWQTLEVRRHALTELVTHEFVHIYQYQKPDYFLVKRKGNEHLNPPRELIEGIAKFVTLQSGIAWKGVKTPELLYDLPKSWDSDEEHAAYFLMWLENVRNGTGSIALLNEHISKQYYWGKDGVTDGGSYFWNSLFGADVEDLWTEYSAYVTREGYMHPMDWIKYSFISPKEAPQETIRWLTRIWNRVVRKSKYGVRLAYLVYHPTSPKTRFMAFCGILLASFVSIRAYGILYMRLYKTQDDIHRQVTLAAMSSSLLSAGWYRTWHGLRMIVSGMAHWQSALYFVIWNGFVALLRVKSTFFPFAYWGFNAVPNFFGRQLIKVINFFLCIVLTLVYSLLRLSNILLRYIGLLPIIVWAVLKPAISRLFNSLKFVIFSIIWVICYPIYWLFSSSENSLSRSLSPSPFSSPSISGRATPTPSPPSSPDSSHSSSSSSSSSRSRSGSPVVLHKFPPSPPGNTSPAISEATPVQSPPTFHPAHTTNRLPIFSGESVLNSPFVPSTSNYTSPPSVPIHSIPLWHNADTWPIPKQEPMSPEQSYFQQQELNALEEPEEEAEEEEEEEEESGPVIEAVLRSRLYGKKLKYRVKWRGLPADQRWHDARELREQPQLLSEFHAEYPDQVGPPVRLSDWLAAAGKGEILRDHADDNVARRR